MAGNRVPDGLTVAQWVAELRDTEHTCGRFYRSGVWRSKRRQVLEDAHWECEDCKANSPAVYTRATVVHHVLHLVDRPDLALSDWYVDEDGERHRQLVPLCRECHERRHGRSRGCTKSAPLTEERW